MLLWSVLYLSGTRVVNAQYERLGEPAVTLDDIRQFPPGRKQSSGSSCDLLSDVRTADPGSARKSSVMGSLHQRKTCGLSAATGAVMLLRSSVATSPGDD